MRELDFSLIGQRIKEIRTAKKLTQEYLAEKTGVNVSHISNIETIKDMDHTKLETLLRIAKVL